MTEIDLYKCIKKASTRAISILGCEQTGWKPVSMKEAEKIVKSKTVEQLDSMTGAASAVKAAATTIEDWTNSYRPSILTMKRDCRIMINKARDRVHDTWMAHNVEKFIDPERKDRMWQFLPALTLPLDEVKKDDIFIQDAFEAITGEKWEDHSVEADRWHQENSRNILLGGLTDQQLGCFVNKMPPAVREALMDEKTKQALKDSVSARKVRG